jgi:glycosyltransferase involved in cell wall biosynthesis
MIKIAFVDTLGLTYDGSTLTERGLGGSESAVISMSRELAKLNFDVYVFNDCASDDSKPGIYDNVKYLPLKEIESFNSFDIFIASRSVVSFMPDNMKHQFKWADRLPNLEKVAMNSTYRVLWMHDTFCDGDIHIEELITTRRIHTIFTLSDWHTAYVTNCHHGKRRHFETLKNHIFQTRNGINLYLNDVDIRNKDPNLFVYNASVTKGMIPLVEKIWPEFKKQNPNAKLIVIGGFYRFRSEHGPDEQELKHRELVEKCKDLDITFTGIIKQDEIAAILARASFMMYPSAFPETFGISTLESLAYNTPLITCNNGALEETAIDIASYKLTYAIEPNVLFTEIDTDKQCERFIRLSNIAYRNPYSHQQKMYACNQVKDVCTWDTVALQWKQHFYKQFIKFLPVEEYRKVTDINNRVQKVFGRRFINNQEQSVRKQTERRINVIVPVYNAENYIDKCIQSVASQDYDNYHMYIINDASTDSTLNVIMNTVDSFNENIKQRFSVLNRTQNMGAVCNQISTIKSRCYSDEIVMLLDGDDWLVNDPNIFNMYNNLYADGAEYTYGSCWSLVDNIPLIAQPYPAEVKKNKSYRNYKFNWNFPYPHLRTFLARLVLNLDDSLFKDENGYWYGAGGDNSTFYNIIEQANPDKVICVSDVVYNYNDTNPINDYKVNGEEQNKTAKNIVNKKEMKMNELENMLNIAKNAPGSDINEHLQTLKNYADMCYSVIEMGVREGASTVAFLNSDSKLTSYDLYISKNVTGYFEIAKRYGKDCTYLQGDTRVLDIEPCDMLFIDTEHTYEQLTIELNRHHSKVKSFIAFHDTVTFPDLLVALNDFLKDHSEWTIIEHHTNNNGLTVIARISELFTVVVPTMWRREDYFETQLKQIHTHPLIHEIVIYNNNTFHTPEWLKELSTKVKVKKLGIEDKNYFVNPCWNDGVTQSNTKRICLMNDDVTFDSKLFDRIYRYNTQNNGAFGLITGEEKFGHPVKTNGAIDFKKWSKGDIIHGFGQLMFVHKDNWVPIVDGLDIYFGDDFIFHSHLEKGLDNYMIHNIEWESPMAATSSDQSIVGGFYEREKVVYSDWADNHPIDYERKQTRVKKILIAVPTARYIEPETFKSIHDLIVPEGYEVTFQFFYGYQIDQIRNLIADWVVKGFDYLFSVDSDITFDPLTLDRLLNHDKDVVSGLYRQRVGDVVLEAYDREYRNIPANMMRQNSLIEVGAVGFGCVLVKKEVFETIGYPQFVYKSGLTTQDTFSEDVYFCKTAREKGYSVWLDSGILCGHKGTTWFNLYPAKNT